MQGTVAAPSTCARVLTLAAGAILVFALIAPAMAAPLRGEPPPDALGRDRSGADVSISQHRGKVVIVTFWASWCGPCRRELPILGKLRGIVGPEHLEIIAINYKEPRREFLDVIRGNPGIALTWVHDTRGVISASYGVEALPHMFIIDRDGNLAHVHRGYSAEMIDGFVQEMLALLPAEVLAQPAGS